MLTSFNLPSYKINLPSAPQFSGRFTPWQKKKAGEPPSKNLYQHPFEPGLENKYYNKREQFIDGINAKIKSPIYTVFGKWLKLPVIKQKAANFETEKIITQQLTQLETLLNTKNWSKKAGLTSVFWQAYHLPSQLNLSKEETVSYLDKSYLPLIQSLDTPQAFRTAQWVLEGLGNTHTDVNHITQTTDRLRELHQNNSPYLPTLTLLVEWFQNRLTDAFYTQNVLTHPPLTPATPHEKRSAYRHEQGKMATTTLMPYLLSSAVTQTKLPKAVADYLSFLLPDTLNNYAKNYPPVRLVINQEKHPLSGFRLDFDKTNLMLAELLHHTLVLTADLTAIPLKSMLINSIQQLKQATTADPKNTDSGSNQTDLYLSHDDLDAHITETLLEYNA